MIDTTVDTTVETLAESASETLIGFHPESFVENLSYLGIGMLAIIIVMGVIIGSIVLLNAVTSRPKKKKDKAEK